MTTIVFRRPIIFRALAITLFAMPLFAADVDIDALTERVDAFMSSWDKDTSPGAAILIACDGEILLKKGYGMADVESKTPIEPDDTAFLLASVTKPFTALSIIMCEERGLLDYDDSLTKIFPEFPIFVSGVTVRHLLNHTGGLYEYERLFMRNGQVDRAWPRSAKTPRSQYEPTSKDTLQIIIEKNKLRFEPGSRFEYSNSGYVVLAQIVEKVDGRSFAQFLKEEIFDPVGMSQSILYDESEPVIKNRATSYERHGKNASNGTPAFRDIDYTPLNFIYGEDNIYTTIEDMFKFDQALYTEELVSAASLQKAFTPPNLKSAKLSNYGFGWTIREEDGKRFVFHGGAWLGFRTYFRRDIDEGITYIYLSNFSDDQLKQVKSELPKILRESMRH
jgi:CubicO group peptidase (beta-lactamase class C family)